MVGRFVEKKGLPDGLAACLHAAQRGVNLRVTIIGDELDTDGQEIKRQLVSLAAKPALAGRVFFTGFVSQPEMLGILKQQNILLCPSKHAANGDAEGGMPFVLAEAMAMGVIGIGSRHCDMEELISDGRTGYLFDEGDVDGLAALICQLPAMADRSAEIAAAARRHVEKYFNLSKQLAILGDIYRNCVSGNNVPRAAND
jgi:colanic acid/amylovoran biosynthesis glycosyltransferase